MPRRTTDPVIEVVRFFEESPLEALPLVLAVLKEIVRRRLGGETIIRQDGTPHIDLPLPKKRRGPNKPKPPATIIAPPVTA